MDDWLIGVFAIGALGIVAATVGMQGIAVMMGAVGVIRLFSAYSHPEDQQILFALGNLQIIAAAILWVLVQIRDNLAKKQLQGGKTPGKTGNQDNDNTHR